MAIPESQLDTWSHQGSITQSSATYATIKSALENGDAAYAAHGYRIFLQGSYGNDTNIYAESDVDVVIVTDSSFYHDLSALPQNQIDAFNAIFSDAKYTYNEFKRNVMATLVTKFGESVKQGEKAVKIEANGSRRNCDVLIANQFRRYHKFLGVSDQTYDEGISFYTLSGKRIANYPRQHSENCTSKHQATNSWFKPMVRILKNLRGRLVEEGKIGADVAPSYYIEGLLYNVPADKFGGSYAGSFVNGINWIMQADRKKFLCANEQYYLLWQDSATSWAPAKCEEFLSAAIDLWNRW